MDCTPDGGVGICRWCALTSAAAGQVVVTIRCGSAVIIRSAGARNIGGCAEGRYRNFNAIVQSACSTLSIPARPALNVCDHSCIAGTGKGEFQELCAYICTLDYYPPTACLCNKLGTKVIRPRGPAS